MKKIYISPNLLTVELHATNMMALSLNNEQINSDNSSDYEQNTKEFNSSSNGSIWDNEW